MNNDKSEHEKTDRNCIIRAASGRYLARVVSFGLLLVSFVAFAANEGTLGVLQIGDHKYHDVTVRTKAKDYILIVHSSGISSIKVAQLPADVREKLGYAPERDKASALTPKRVANRAVAWAEGTKAQILQEWQRTGLGPKLQRLGTYPTVVAVIAALMIAHLVCSYCCMLICQKAGITPTVLLWFPVLQAVPMLRAASMSVWWLGALLVPGLNLLGWGLWCVRIVAARQKTMSLAILLMFPLTSWFGFLFLAFSEDSRHKGEKVRVEALTLQSIWTSKERSGTSALLQSEQHIVA